MGFFPLETIQPHPAAAAAATQAVQALVRHLHQFHAWDCGKQGARFIKNAIDTTQIAGIMIGDLCLDFIFQQGLELVESFEQELCVMPHGI